MIILFVFTFTSTTTTTAPKTVSYGHGAPTRYGLTCAVPGGRMWSAECGVRSDCEVALATSYSKF